MADRRGGRRAPRRRRPPRRPGHRDHRVLRLRAASARPRRRPPSGCARPRPAAASSCSPSTRPAAWPSPSASPSSTTCRGRSRASATRPAARSHAMMLDMKRTFDEVVEAHSTPEKAAQILANPFYQSVSSSFAGTQEYMAMEKLGQLRAEAAREGTWDLIVVDTPPVPLRPGLPRRPQAARLLPRRPLHPAAHRAGPRRRQGLPQGLQRRGRRSPRRRSPRCSAASSSRTCRPSSRRSTRCSAGFRERADVTYALLKEPTTAFVVVAAPERDALREAAYFVDRLESEGMPLAGVVVNRLQMLAAPALSGSRAAAAAEQLERDGAGTAGGRAASDDARRAHRGPAAAARRPGRGRGPARGARATVRRRAPRRPVVDGAGRRHGHPRPRGAAHGRVRARRRLRPAPAAGSDMKNPRGPTCLARLQGDVTRGCRGGRPAGGVVGVRSGDGALGDADLGVRRAARSTSGRRGDDGAGPGARARSCRPRHRTRCGCRGRRRGTRRRRGSPCRPPWRRAGPCPGRRARRGRCRRSGRAPASPRPTDHLWGRPRVRCS